jgi:hypothetical protein
MQAPARTLASELDACGWERSRLTKFDMQRLAATAGVEHVKRGISFVLK